MKKCPFCAEEIQEEAIKCRFCGEFINKAIKAISGEKWYHSISVVVMGILIMGPFALPLVWNNPKFNRITKIMITVVIILITLWSCSIIFAICQKFAAHLTEQLEAIKSF